MSIQYYQNTKMCTAPVIRTLLCDKSRVYGALLATTVSRETMAQKKNMEASARGMLRELRLPIECTQTQTQTQAREQTSIFLIRTDIDQPASDATLPFGTYSLDPRTDIEADSVEVCVFVLFTRRHTLVFCGALSMQAVREANYHIQLNDLLQSKNRNNLRSRSQHEFAPFTLESSPQPQPQRELGINSTTTDMEIENERMRVLTPPSCNFALYTDTPSTAWKVTETRELATWRLHALEDLHLRLNSRRLSTPQRYQVSRLWHEHTFTPYDAQMHRKDVHSFQCARIFMAFFLPKTIEVITRSNPQNANRIQREADALRKRYLEAECTLLWIRLTVLCANKEAFERTVRASITQSPYQILGIQSTQAQKWYFTENDGGSGKKEKHFAISYKVSRTLLCEKSEKFKKSDKFAAERDLLRLFCVRNRKRFFITERSMWTWFHKRTFGLSTTMPPRAKRKSTSIKRSSNRTSTKMEITNLSMKKKNVAFTTFEFAGDAFDQRLALLREFDDALRAHMIEPRTHELHARRHPARIHAYYEIPFEAAPHLLRTHGALMVDGNLYVPWFEAHYQFAYLLRRNFTRVCDRYETKRLEEEREFDEDSCRTLTNTLIRGYKELRRATISSRTGGGGGGAANGVPLSATLTHGLPPCMAQLNAKLLATGHIGHTERYPFCTFLFKLGYEREEIEDYLRTHWSEKRSQQRAWEKEHTCKDLRVWAKKYEESRTANSHFGIGCNSLAQRGYCPFSRGIRKASKLDASLKKGCVPDIEDLVLVGTPQQQCAQFIGTVREAGLTTVPRRSYKEIVSPQHYVRIRIEPIKRGMHS